MEDLISLLIGLLQLAVIAVLIVSAWKVNTKAGYPGWAVFVPFYNVYISLKVAGRPGWWLILLIVPLINLVYLVIPFDTARKFGKGLGYGFGLLFLPFIFYPILAFGNARYRPEL